MLELLQIVWADRAIASKDDAPAIEGPLEIVVGAIGRLPSLAWQSFSIALPDRTSPPFAYEARHTRTLIAKLTERAKTA